VNDRLQDAESVDESFWGSPKRFRFPFTGSYLVDALVLTVTGLVLATLVGLAVLWPHGKLRQTGQLGPIHTVGAVAERVDTVPCKLSASQICRMAHVRILDGPQKGDRTLLTTVAAVGSLDVSQGDRIRVYKNAVPPGTGPAGQRDDYSFADFDRRSGSSYCSSPPAAFTDCGHSSDCWRAC
jgi:hypothetical protein